jgi:hypothetical protein
MNTQAGTQNKTQESCVVETEVFRKLKILEYGLMSWTDGCI